MSYVVRDAAGIEWSVDEKTGRGVRLTAVPRSRATRRPPELVRQFEKAGDAPAERFKASLSAIAANPLLASALVFLLASNAMDRSSAINATGAHYKLAPTEIDLIVGAFLELRRGS